MLSIYSLLAIAALTLSTTANPIPIWGNLKNILQPKTPATLPASSGSTTQLSPPSAGLVLKYVTLGRGIQNYTCTAGVASPVANGAIATLFDITPLASSPLIHLLPSLAVYQKLPAGNAVNSISYPGTDRLLVIGKHFFDSAGTPVFDLHTKGKKFFGKKIGQVDPPANAAKGPAGTGAVLWLKLDDKGGSNGLKEVYRVVTAGGNPTPHCKKVGVFSVEYATEYWFYG